MENDISVADRLRELRWRRGLSQEELAAKAELSVDVIRKLERGGTARMETYSALARALGVVTLVFVTPGSPEPQTHGSPQHDIALADIRSAINPAAGLDGKLLRHIGADTPDLDMLTQAANVLGAAYHADEYDKVARLSPAVVRSAHLHVAELDGREQEQAQRLRADALNVVGRYLIQVREHDLALIALRDSLNDAVAVGDEVLAAAAISSQAWALMRQGRFAEVEEVCAASADRVEPRLSKATPDQLSAWGWLLLRASAASARNNKPDKAREYLRFAHLAASPLPEETPVQGGHARWGPVTVGTKGPEMELVAGAPDTALRLSEGIPRDAGETMRSDWHRHRTDVAKAKVMTGDVDGATGILTELRLEAPEWLRYQQSARDTASDILASRGKMPTQEQRDLADFLGVPV